METFKPILSIENNKEGIIALEKETGINESLLKKIAENPGLKKAFIYLTTVAGLLIMNKEAGAQTNNETTKQGEEKNINYQKPLSSSDSVFMGLIEDPNNWTEVKGKKNERPSYDPNPEENINKNDNLDLLKKIELKEIKNLLKGYEQMPGDLPLEMILDNSENFIFQISEPVVGEILTAAKLSSLEKLKIAGIHFPSKIFTFYTKLSNGNIRVIQLIKTPKHE